MTEENYIQIEPTNPDTIYVPQYIPEQVVNPGYPVATFAAGVAVSNWWHYNNVNWAARNIAVNPLYLNHYNYRAGGYYANNLVPRAGYGAAGVWRPTPYAANASYARWGTTANVNRANLNNLNTSNLNRASTSDISSRLQQGLKSGGSFQGTMPGNRSSGAFSTMNSGSSARMEGARGASSRSSFQNSAGSFNRGSSGGSFNRSSGGGGYNRGGGRRR